MERGISLIESILVVAVVGATVFLLVNLPNALGLIAKARHLSLVREIASREIETKRNVSFINLVNGTEVLSDSRMSILPQGSGSVMVEDCDPAICESSESVKEITVTVNWKEGDKDQGMSLKTFIGEGGINQ